MFRYIIKRLIQMLPLLVIISFIAFGVTKLAPGDPLTQLKMNPSVSQETIEREKQRLGLDKAWYVQYWRWVTNFAKGDMGTSIFYKTDVGALIMQRVPNTLYLGITALLFTWLVAIPVGIFLAVRQYSWIDKIFSSGFYLALGFPDFLLALLLLLLAAATGWFPVGGMSSRDSSSYTMFAYIIDVVHHMILPAIAIAFGSIAILQRRMRANLLDVLHEDYIRMARAKGLPENTVIYKHALRNAINPLVTLLGYELAALLSGAAFVEIIFSWPGLGQMMLEAVTAYDYNLVMAGLVIGALMLMLGNLLADLLLAAVDPRIKLEA